MNVQKEFGEILKKEPRLIFVEKDQHRPHIGWVYKDGIFVSLHDILQETHVTIRG